MRLGTKEFNFVVARSITVELLAKGGDITVPDSQPMVLIRCEITTFRSSEGSAARRRNGTRAMYYNLETGAMTKRPNGQKGWDETIKNMDDIEAYIQECLTVGSEQ